MAADLTWLVSNLPAGDTWDTFVSPCSSLLNKISQYSALVPSPRSDKHRRSLGAPAGNPDL